MSQFIKKREIIILAILGTLLYVFFYVKMVLFPVLPEIESKQVIIAGQLQQKNILDQELINIEAKRNECKLKSFNSEHLGEYLMDTAGVTDGLEYIEKISRMMGKGITSVNINTPGEISAAAPANGSGGTDAGNANSAGSGTPVKYYEFKTDFKTTLSYNEAMELIRYCEGGTRKVRIANFTLSAAAGGANAAGTAPASQVNPAQNAVPSQSQDREFVMADNSQKFDIGMSICFYSLNKGNVDRLYDYSQSKFQKFIDSSGIPIGQKKTGNNGSAATPDIASSDIPASRPGEPSEDGKITLASADLVIKEVGYLVGGENFELFAQDHRNDRIRIKTKDLIHIYLKLSDNAYSVDADDGCSIRSLGGNAPDRAFTIYVDSRVPYAKENQNIGVTIKIANQTEKAVNVALAQRTGQIKLLDRHGNEVFLKSELEKICIV